MLRESITLKDLDDRHQDVRAWCFRCARGAVVDTIMWQRFEARGWPQDLQAAAARFTCNSCSSAEHVALYPARRPPLTQDEPERLVARYFFTVRGMRKRGELAGVCFPHRVDWWRRRR